MKDGESKQAEDSFLKCLVQTIVTAYSMLTSQGSKCQQRDMHEEGAAREPAALPASITS